jgi:uncharacterized protein
MVADLLALSRSSYNFDMPVDTASVANGDRLFLEILETPAFQRLHSVRFLGAIDYFLIRAPNGYRGNIRYTRFQHSVGVAALALRYCELAGLTGPTRRLVFTAALLHDVGHPPFSHSLEPIFRERYGLEHHIATLKIIRGETPLGAKLYNILRSHHIDVERLISIIEGREDEFHSFFSGPINFDTVEGILRSRMYVRPDPIIPSPEAVIEAAYNRSSASDLSIVDEFWSSKDTIYRHLINSQAGIFADSISREVMKENITKFSATDFFATENDIFNKVPVLRASLDREALGFRKFHDVDRSTSYTARRFSVNDSADFFKRDDQNRYQQTRTAAFQTIRLATLRETAESTTTRDWLNDGCDHTSTNSV